MVLGIGFGAVPHVCGELIAAEPAWQAMVREVRSVATQAFQVWLDKPVNELGWTLPPINISGYVEPFDTWADMGQLIALEDWPAEPKAIAYFCSVLPDAEIAAANGEADPGKSRRPPCARRRGPLPRPRCRPFLARRRLRGGVPLGSAQPGRREAGQDGSRLRHPVLDRQRQPDRPLRAFPCRDRCNTASRRSTTGSTI